MSDSTHLERCYRRLLALYPRAFRREHEQEMLSVLSAGAADGQRRPALAETIDLLRTAIFMRLRQMRLLPSYEYRHARLMIRVRVGIGIWLLVLAGILSGYGQWWAWGLLAPFAALHFYLAYRLGHPAHT